MNKSLAAAVLAAGLAPTAAGASAFGVDHHNAKAIGAAYAGAQAEAGDVGFVFYNPAAIAGLERAELSSNATLFWGPARYEALDGQLLGAFPNGGDTVAEGILPPAFIPSFAVAAPLGDRVVVGFSVHTPFGLRSEYDPTSAVRYYALESALLTFAATPTVAVKLSDAISIGAGLRLQYADISLTQAIDAGGIAFASGVPGFLPGSDDAIADFDASDLAIGATAGIQAQLGDSLRVGFSYASRITHDLSGDAEFGLEGSVAAQTLNGLTGIFAPTDFTADLPLPATYGFGAQVHATPRLTLAASATLTRWSALDRIVFAFDNPAQPPEVATSDWSDTWAFSFGGDYRVNDRMAIRAGYMHEQSPVNDALVAPRIPDSPRHWATFGASRDLTERASLDVAAVIVFTEGDTLARDGLLPEDLFRGSLTGALSGRSYGVSSRLRWRF